MSDDGDDKPLIRLDTSEDGIATITLDNPDLHNAISDEFIEELGEILEDLHGADGVFAVVLQSTGKSFCAGADLNWMKRAAHFTEEQNREDAEALGEMLRRLNFLDKPTLALVQGPCYGGGVGIVACCDIAIAVKSAAFTLSEVKLGLIPATISPYVVRAIGQRAARRYFVTAERFGAPEAARLGLLTEVVEDAAALAAARDRFVEILRANAPGAVADSKQLVFDVSDRPIEGRMISMTAQRIADRRATDEGKEGIAAFLDRRKPNWKA
ncbi:MAG: enoyl-CoA hydratase/isomerase family protein [Alphaproteobacteria bacterium]|nr:enoyl-CoA hydratase/isomerase family protein [Alphaproteobacteria bacterium]